MLLVALASLAILEAFDMRPCMIPPVNDQGIWRLASALRITLALCLYALTARLLPQPRY